MWQFLLNSLRMSTSARYPVLYRRLLPLFRFAYEFCRWTLVVTGNVCKIKELLEALLLALNGLRYWMRITLLSAICVGEVEFKQIPPPRLPARDRTRACDWLLFFRFVSRRAR